MKENILAIIDHDELYLNKFMNYFCTREEQVFECYAFSDEEMLCKFSREKAIDILIISSDVSENTIKKIKALKILSMLEENNPAEQIKKINRYQPVSNIYREVMKNLADMPVSAVQITGSKVKETELIAVYSPVGRTLKTTFAIALGQMIAEKKKTLYLNLEEYAGFDRSMQNTAEADILDLIFYMHGKQVNFSYKLASMVKEIEGMDYIPPAIAAYELTDIEAADWQQLLDRLSECGYEVVIIDTGNTIRGIPEIMERCKKIYMPVRDDPAARTKISQFETAMRISGHEKIIKRIQKFSFPYFEDAENHMDNIKNSSVGRYIRKINI